MNIVEDDLIPNFNTLTPKERKNSLAQASRNFAKYVSDSQNAFHGMLVTSKGEEKKLLPVTIGRITLTWLPRDRKDLKFSVKVRDNVDTYNIVDMLQFFHLFGILYSNIETLYEGLDEVFEDLVNEVKRYKKAYEHQNRLIGTQYVERHVYEAVKSEAENAKRAFIDKSTLLDQSGLSNQKCERKITLILVAIVMATAVVVYFNFMV